jgi:hypothetical protein
VWGVRGVWWPVAPFLPWVFFPFSVFFFFFFFFFFRSPLRLLCSSSEYYLLLFKMLSSWLDSLVSPPPSAE